MRSPWSFLKTVSASVSVYNCSTMFSVESFAFNNEVDNAPDIKFDSFERCDISGSDVWDGEVKDAVADEAV